jgi:hypothetical protein
MATEPRKGAYLTRESYYQYTYHQFDDLKNVGYNWRENAMKRSVSHYLINDNKRRLLIDQYQKFVNFIMDYASNIKKSFNYTVDKNYKYLN